MDFGEYSKGHVNVIVHKYGMTPQDVVVDGALNFLAHTHNIDRTCLKGPPIYCDVVIVPSVCLPFPRVLTWQRSIPG